MTAVSAPDRKRFQIRPGPNLVRIFAGLLVVAPLVFIFPQISWIVAVPIPIFVLTLLDLQSARRIIRELTVLRDMPGIAGRDRPFSIRWTLEQAGSSALAGMLRECLPPEASPDIHLQPFSFATGDRRLEFTHEIRIPVRGHYTIGPLWIRLTGRLGLIEVQRSIDGQAEIRILPETYHSPDDLARDSHAQIQQLDKAAHTRQHGTGTEFESLHEYRDGDDPRRIDWRATARMRRPIVRRYQIERHRDVMIVIDSGRLMGTDAGRGSKLDCAVDSGLMLARAALQGGDRCGMAVFDSQVVGYLPPVSGVGSMNSIANCVYDVQTQWRESDFTRMFAMLQQRQRKRSLVVILSDLVDVETTVRFRASLANLARRHIVLFAALQTPAIQQIATSRIESQLDGAQAAVSFRLLRERTQALHSVRRSSVSVLDLEPSQLTVPLINRFVELRQSNRM